MSQIFQLAYLSKATRPFSDPELRDICTRSSINNRDGSVTGLLLHDGMRFMQALEGPEVAVRRTMARIAADQRHRDIDYLSTKLVEERQFGTWSMTLGEAPSGCCSRDFLTRVKADVEIVSDLPLKAAFIGFAVLGADAPSYRCEAS